MASTPKDLSLTRCNEPVGSAAIGGESRSGRADNPASPEGVGDLLAERVTSARGVALINSPSEPGYVRSYLFGMVESQKYRDRREESLRTLAALGEVWRRSATPGNSIQDRAETEAEVRRLVEAGAKIDAQAFQGISAVLNGGDRELSEKIRADAHYGEKLLQTLGILGGALHPGAGVALSVAGTWAEEGLVALANPGVFGFLPPTEPERIALINHAAMTAIHEVAEKFERFRQEATAAGVKNVLGLDIDAPLEHLLGGAPEGLRDLIRNALGRELVDVRNDTQLARDLIAKLNAHVEEGLGELQRAQEEIHRVLSQLREAELSEWQRHRILAETEWKAGEIRGVLDVGAFLIGAVLGKPETARTLQTVGHAAVQVYQATAQFLASNIGKFALMGAYVGAASAIIGFFAAGPSEIQQLAEQVRRIEEKIDALRAHLDSRLNQMDLLLNIWTTGMPQSPIVAGGLKQQADHG